MTKLMCVSAQFCEAHLPLLFKILETSKDPIVRSNIVIALGDIALCFSNMIDEVSRATFYATFLKYGTDVASSTEQRPLISRPRGQGPRG